MNCKGFERNWLVTLRFHLAVYMWGGLRKSRKNSSWFSDWLIFDVDVSEVW